MLQNLSYKYYHRCGSKIVYLVLHGGGPEGIETPFIANVINRLGETRDSVFGFNFPYCERGEQDSSGETLSEETAALETVVKFLRCEGYEQIVIVAKSLGGITTSYWLEQHEANDIQVVILGYVIGSVKTEALKNVLRLVVQGEKDRFGDGDSVTAELAKFSISADVLEVPKADHSYRNEQKDPVHQDEAIDMLIKRLTS